jgi:hypothetical protein
VLQGFSPPSPPLPLPPGSQRDGWERDALWRAGLVASVPRWRGDGWGDRGGQIMGLQKELEEKNEIIDAKRKCALPPAHIPLFLLLPLFCPLNLSLSLSLSFSLVLSLSHVSPVPPLSLFPSTLYPPICM